MRTAAERRHRDWQKAVRKKRISDAYCDKHPWYNNLHQYSKNKIHCSCPICRSKTNDKSLAGPAMNWPVADLKQLDRMSQQKAEIQYEESVSMTQQIKLNAPWVTMYRMISALFSEDPEISVEYNEASNEVRLHVRNRKKAAALQKILPSQKVYGNTVLKIVVNPIDEDDETLLETYAAAFENNPVFSCVYAEGGQMPRDFVIFKDRTVQFYNDNLGDPYGNQTTLCQNIANDIFENRDGILFCTEPK